MHWGVQARGCGVPGKVGGNQRERFGREAAHFACVAVVGGDGERRGWEAEAKDVLPDSPCIPQTCKQTVVYQTL